MTPPRRHLALVGLTGAGKTSVGQELARMLDRPLLDSDVMIEQEHAATGAEIDAARGTSELHAVEHATTRRMLAHSTAAVLAVPASAADDPELRHAVAGAAYVVWLRASPVRLAARMATQHHRRPLDEADLERLLAAREDGYAAMADVVVETEGRSPAAIAADIVAAHRG